MEWKQVPNGQNTSQEVMEWIVYRANGIPNDESSVANAASLSARRPNSKGYRNGYPSLVAHPDVQR